MSGGPELVLWLQFTNFCYKLWIEDMEQVSEEYKYLQQSFWKYKSIKEDTEALRLK